MITLEKEFVSGVGGYSQNPLTYKQLTRTETVALYARYRGDGSLKDHEVFKIKVLKKGHRIFDKILDDDIEQYPSTEKFGKIAWSIKHYASAIIKYNELVSGKIVEDDVETFEDTVHAALDMTPKARGRKRKERSDLVYPSGNQWFMKDLVAANPEWSQPLAYQQLQKDIGAGVIVEVARVSNGRGKPAVAYKTVDTK